MQSAANPYQSPTHPGGKPLQPAGPYARFISWRRGFFAAAVAGMVGAAIPMFIVMGFLFAMTPSVRGEETTGLQFDEALMISSVMATPFMLLASMAALANYTPATRRGMIPILGQQASMLMLGIGMMIFLGMVLPEERFDGIVVIVSLAGSFSLMILWGIFSTLRQVRHDRMTYRQ